MKIAISGLGKMGIQIAQKLQEGGHKVIAHNRSKEPVDVAAGFGATPAYTKQEVINSFAGEQVILWIMITSTAVDAELDEWLQILPSGSVIIDGGNSDFRLTKKRSEKTKGKGIDFVDVGTSGGVWGYKNGFSMMVGGNTDSASIITPVLDTLALPNGAHQYFGESGAGHYVKMVHNAAEYGMMQSLAEGYRMLKEGPYQNLDLAAAGEVWQHGSVVASWLNELTRQALVENPTLEGIEGKVSENGETRWTLEVAKEMNIPLPAIQISLDVRTRSQEGEVNFATKLLSAMRNKFGGHSLNK